MMQKFRVEISFTRQSPLSFHLLLRKLDTSWGEAFTRQRSTVLEGSIHQDYVPSKISKDTQPILKLFWLNDVVKDFPHIV